MEAELHDEPAVETEDHSMEDKTIAHDSMVTVRLSETPLTINTNVGGAQEIQQESAATIEEVDEESPRITMMDPNGNEVTSPSGSESAESQDGESRRGSDSSADSEQVNWEELEKTEEQEPRDQGSDDVSCMFPSWNNADDVVYGFTASETGAGKQSAGHESQIRHQSPDRESNPIQVETAVHATPEETGQWPYTACVEVLDDPGSPNDRS